MEERLQFLPDEDLFFDIIPFQSLSQTQNWGIKMLGAEQAWAQSRGEGVRVAILDTGICKHPDLNWQEDLAFNCSNDSSYLDEVSGHGTHVAGIVNAIDNDQGVIGIAPGCTIIPIKVLDNNGGGSFGNIVKGIKKALEMDAHIISMSLGTNTPPPNEMSNLVYEVGKRGVIMVAAAGNDAGDVNYPARYDEVIAVAALDEQGQPAKFTSKGQTIDLCGPGVDIYSTFINQSYAKMSGTSQACPFIAGICALLLSYDMKHNNPRKINNYVDMLKALNSISENSPFIPIEGDNKWGFGCPSFGNIDWQAVYNQS